MRSLRLPAALMTLLTAALVLAGPARAETDRGVVLSYEMWQGGFQPFKIELRIANSGDSYRAAFLAETSGVVGWAYPYQVEALSEGQAGQAGLQPGSFRSTTRQPDEKRLRWITYGVNRKPVVGFDPPRTGTDEDAPTAAQIANTMDPVSGLVAVIDRVRNGGRCTGVIPVFDGKRAYNLHAVDRGTKHVKSNDYGVFEGKASICRLSIEKVAGYRKNRKKRFAVQYLPENLDIWFASAVPGNGPVPVRMEGKTDLGGVVIHLVKIDRNPKIWEAMLPKRKPESRRKTWERDRSNHR